MGTRKITPADRRAFVPPGQRKPTESRAAARDRGVPSTPAELARAASRLTPQQVAMIGAQLMIAERLERIDLSLARVLDVLIKHAGRDVAVATGESVQAVAAAIDHLGQRVAALEARAPKDGAPGLSFGRRGSKRKSAEMEGGGDVGQ